MYGLARIIPERFCCNCGFAAATSLDAIGTASRQAGLPIGRSTYCWGLAPSSWCLSPSEEQDWHPADVEAGPLGSGRLSRVALSRRTGMNNAG